MGKKIKIKAYDGSTMSNLAEILGTTVEELKKYNNLDSNIVKVGQEFSWETDDVEGIKSRLSKVQNRLQQKRQAIVDAETKKKADENAKRNMQWVESKRQDYGDLTQHQIRDYQNFVKSGKGKTIADFKAYKERESKDAQSTRDLALKAGQGIVGMAGITSLGTTVLPTIANSNLATAVGHTVKNFATNAATNTVNGVTKFIANPLNTTKQATISSGKFILKQMPWIAGSHLANKGLDAAAGNTSEFQDPDHWANNRYVRGAANAVGMAGGNFTHGLLKGASKYGLKYIPRAAGALTQNMIGGFGSTLSSMEGMAAMDHLAETADIQNPFGRAAMGTLGMIVGHNVNRMAMNGAKKALGTAINKNYTDAANFANSGNVEQAQKAYDTASKQYKLLDNSLVSKALDVRGSGTMPWVGSTVEHIPVGLAMQAGAVGEHVFGTDILHNPIVQAALVKGAQSSYKPISEIGYSAKRRSGLKSTTADVMSEILSGKNTASGTYGTNVKSNGILQERWFPEHASKIKEVLKTEGLYVTPEMESMILKIKNKKPNIRTKEEQSQLESFKQLSENIKSRTKQLFNELVSEQEVIDKYRSLSPEEQADFVNSPNNALRTRSYNHYELSHGERGYLDIEHGRFNRDLFNYPGFVYQGIQRSLPLNYTPEQFYAAAASKIAGPRHGFGFKYGVMVPKESVRNENFNTYKFKTPEGTAENMLIEVPERGYVFNPKFKADAGFRGSDALAGFKNGEAKWTNIAGHVGTVTEGDHSVKIGVDTPGYGNTSTRYQGASQMLGTLFGKTLDYFTPRPYYTSFGEYMNPNGGKIFSNTTNVQAGSSKTPKMRTYSNYLTPTGMIPVQQQGPASFKDYIYAKQQDKVNFLHQPDQLAIKQRAAISEQLKNLNYINKHNQIFNTNYSNNLKTIYKDIGKILKLPYEGGYQFDPSFNRKAYQFLMDNKSVFRTDNTNAQKAYDGMISRLNRDMNAYQDLTSHKRGGKLLPKIIGL